MKLDALDNALSCRDRALFALRGDDALAALTHARVVLERSPDDASARWIEARALARLNRWREALAAMDVLDRLADRAVDPTHVQRLRMFALQQVGRDDLALRLAQRRWGADAHDDEAAEQVVRLSLRVGDRRGAIAALETMTGRGDARPDTLRLLAELAASDRPQVAIDALERLGEGIDAVSRRRLARLCVKCERMADAEAHYRVLLEARADDAGLWVEAGRLADRRGELRLALRRLKRALAMPGDHQEEARAALAVALMHAGRFARAGAQWWRLARCSTVPLAGWAGLMVCALIERRPRLAAAAQARLEGQTSRDERRRMLAGLWREAAGPAAVRQAMHSKDAQCAPRSILAAMLRDASQVLAREAQATPGRADVHYHYAVIESHNGDPTTAGYALDRALAINPAYAAARELSQRLAA